MKIGEWLAGVSPIQDLAFGVLQGVAQVDDFSGLDHNGIL